jgi:hypothetical protein
LDVTASSRRIDWGATLPQVDQYWAALTPAVERRLNHLRCQASHLSRMQRRSRVRRRERTPALPPELPASMLEAKRTLVKSPPELWKIVDDRELMGRLSAELFGSHAIEVVERRPGERLSWRVAGLSEARVELGLAEMGWGTQVAIRVGEHTGRDEGAGGAVLERLLDQLGSAQRPLSAWESASAVGGEDGERAIDGGIEANVKERDRSVSDRASASAERRPVGGFEEDAARWEPWDVDRQAVADAPKIESVKPRSRARVAERREQEEVEQATARTEGEGGGQSLEELSELIMRRASEQTDRARRAADHRLAEARERLRSEAEEADRRARERIEEGERGLSGDERQREMSLARQERGRRIRAAERQLARQASEIFARLEREAGRLHERARRAAAAGAANEVGRRVERSVDAALRELEGKLIASARRGVAEKKMEQARPRPGNLWLGGFEELMLRADAPLTRRGASRIGKPSGKQPG